MANPNNPGTMLDAAQAHAIALAMYNAVSAQQQGAVVRQAAATMVCTAMLSLGVAETAESQPAPSVADTAAQQPAAVASQVADAVNKVAPPVLAVDPAGLAGKAYQSVAQSAAIAIQDAADYLRNVSTIATTAAGVAMAQYLANPAAPEQYAAAIAATQQMMAAAVANFEAIGATAENVLKGFPTD
ncbi:RebB family R body protein [Sphingomonas sp. LB-2]|uniref:RebB family R body protein n=1 Tax=Sphingomonas caeni TaxID=2984949 RepID=UPI00222FC982|nr:RebB family R body protein [Sphingomonas caeni]MCW3849314.1 RebB family R body protein [Sphingomonas caeni]